MFGHRIALFRLFGFEVRIDPSWFIIAALIAWSLAASYFPQYPGLKGLSSSIYWWMGISAALGLFVSIVFHELCHSLVARRYGIPMKGITLFIFGGVAEMDDEPPTAKSEFLMAIAGPIASIVLGIMLFLLLRVGQAQNFPSPVNGVIGYLGFINMLLAAFNLLPAFPLDGGRVLRAALWGWKKRLRWATRIASQVGAGFGAALIVLGLIFFFFAGNLIGGLWWFLIGLFLRNAAHGSYQQLLMRRALEGEKVRRFMNPNPVTVPRHISLEQMVENYVYSHHHKFFPVVDDGQVVGCITTQRIKEVPKDEWSRHVVGEYAQECSQENTISADADAMQALSSMSQKGASRLMVVDEGRLIGIISLKDLLKFFSLKMELEER